MLGSAAAHLNRDISGYRIFCRGCTSVFFPLKCCYISRGFLQLNFSNETVSVFLQKYALYLGVIKGSSVTFFLQNLPIPSRMGNAGAQMQVAQIHRFSLGATQFLGIKKQSTNQKNSSGQAEISEYNCIHLPLQDSFLT